MEEYISGIVESVENEDITDQVSEVNSLTINHSQKVNELNISEIVEALESEDITDPDTGVNLLAVNLSQEVNELNISGIVKAVESEDITDPISEVNPPIIDNSLEKPESAPQRKIKRNSGKPYTTMSGQFSNKREIQILKPCIRNCRNKVTPELQQTMFTQYWNMGNFNLRIAFVAGLIDIQDKKRTSNIKSTTAPRNRKYSYCYYLNVNGVRTQVCHKCLKATLGETDRFLKTVISKKLESSGTIIDTDLRGKSSSKNKISKQRYQHVVDHIKSFPAYESHYSRRQTSKTYLSSTLNLSKMYKCYVQEKPQPVCRTKYSEIFKKLGLKFKKPQLDTCTKCDVLKVKILAAEGTELQNLMKEQTDHHAMAELAYDSKKADIAAASTSSKVFVFDLQKCLPTPFLRSSIYFYKRQLNTFNLTIHDCGTGTPFCYMWHEAIGNRGGNEIASCIREHLIKLPTEVKHITFYSDGCSGQNKNSYVAVMFAIFTSSNAVDIIDHKFLEPGHTHMECDIDHAIIERKKLRTDIRIHHPQDWYQFIRTAGGKNPFIVHEMEQSSFKNYGEIKKSKMIFKKNNENNERVVWREIKWLRYTKQFGKIYYKTTMDVNAPFKLWKIRKNKFPKPTCADVPICYNGPIKINEAKKKDLLSLLNLIDSQFHSFYNELCCESMPDYHPDITEEDNESD